MTKCNSSGSAQSLPTRWSTRHVQEFCKMHHSGECTLQWRIIKTLNLEILAPAESDATRFDGEASLANTGKFIFDRSEAGSKGTHGQGNTVISLSLSNNVQMILRHGGCARNSLLRAPDFLL